MAIRLFAGGSIELGRRSGPASDTRSGFSSMEFAFRSLAENIDLAAQPPLRRFQGLVLLREDPAAAQ
jgi:hypothetical protein